MIRPRTASAGQATSASPAAFLPTVFFLLICLLAFTLLMLFNLRFVHHGATGTAFRFPRITNHDSQITAHEWGTFTSVAAPDGSAMTWLPLIASSGLPSFVEHLQNGNFKGGLRGTIRMETPVLYFYSPQQTTVSVHVSFAQGLITEWYPHADVLPIDPRRVLFSAEKHSAASIHWNSVEIHPEGPGDFPVESADNPYYAARQTSSAPLTINSSAGPQAEKFLFYRGVSRFLPLLTVALSPDGTILFFTRRSLPPPGVDTPQQWVFAPEATDQIPNVILFERRGSRVGFRILGPLTDQASFAAPALDGSLDSLYSDLEGLLIAQGLLPDEAHAMLETWKSSWFEEGSRVLYIIPRSFIDIVLPLTITPATQLTRVFVGRIELVTPATKQCVSKAFATNDRATLAKYGRFLEPILRTMLDSAPDQHTRDRLSAYLDSVYANFYSQPHE